MIMAGVVYVSLSLSSLSLFLSLFFFVRSLACVFSPLFMPFFFSFAKCT